MNKKKTEDKQIIYQRNIIQEEYDFMNKKIEKILNQKHSSAQKGRTTGD